MFPFFNNYPGTDLHEIDLAYILKLCAELRASNTTLTAWKAQHEAEYADLANKVEGLINNLVDVIAPWDSSIAYHVFSIVEYQGTNYIAVQDVPVGAMITNTDYWQPANTVVEQINAIGVVTSDTQEAVENIPITIYPRRKYYRPEDYGAVVNDNTIDNAPFIRQAILDANTNNGIVLFSQGTYYMSTSVIIPEHIYNINFIGTGDSYLGEGGGTVFSYSGNDAAFYFSEGIWGCNFSDFTIVCTGANSYGFRSDDSAGDGTARTHKVVFKNISVIFRYVGVRIDNAAYVYFENCNILAHADYADTVRCAFFVGDPDATANHTEYISMEHCRLVCRTSNAIAVQTSYCVRMSQGSHFYMYDVDMTDADFGLYFETVREINTINIIACNAARVHYGAFVNLNGYALVNAYFQQFVYTYTGDVGDRVYYFKRTSGGAAYNAKFKSENCTIRSGQQNGQMTYFVEAETNSLAQGNCLFTYTMSTAPRHSFGTIRSVHPLFSTLETLAVQTEDLNNFTSAGLVPYRLASASAHSPGFDCMLVVYSNPTSSIQIAIPLAAAGTIAFRIYTASNTTWTAWQLLAKQ